MRYYASWKTTDYYRKDSLKLRRAVLSADAGLLVSDCQYVVLVAKIQATKLSDGAQVAIFCVYFHPAVLQAGCPSCHPTNSVEALKKKLQDENIMACPFP